MHKKLEDLSLEELRHVAEIQGLEIDKRWNSAKLRKFIAQNTSIDTEAVDVPVIEAVEREPEPEAKEDRVRVIFPNSDGVDGSNDVKIVVNGYRYRAKREEEVSLPAEALEVIDNAVIDEDYRDEDGVYRQRKRKRFVYQKV